MPKFIATYHLQGTTVTREIEADNFDEAILQAKRPLTFEGTSTARNNRTQHFVWLANASITAIEVRSVEANAEPSAAEDLATRRREDF